MISLVVLNKKASFLLYFFFRSEKKMFQGILGIIKTVR